MSSIFGGNTGMTYDQIQQKRKVADAMMARAASNTPRNVGEGLQAVGNALLVRAMNRRADAADKKGREAFDSKWGAIVGAMSGVPSGSMSISEPPRPQNPFESNLGQTGPAPDVPKYDMGESAAWAGLEDVQQGIFQGESGGDYDALFGYANRPGGQFENVKLTDMTVDDALAFSAPSGPYGQSVKGQIGRVATPMGAYQVVGTTLRAAKDGLGLTGNERMTPELQDRIGRWIYDNQGTGAWEGYRGPASGGRVADAGGFNQASLLQMAELANDPYATPGQKAVVNALIQRQLQASDPLRQLQIQKAQKDLQTPQTKFDVKQLSDGRFYYVDPTGAQQPRLVNPDATPQQAAPVVKTLKLADGSETAVQWDKQAGTWVPIDAPEGGGTANPKNKLTENQSKLTLFQTMMGETAPVLEQLEQVWDPAQFSEHAAGYFGPAGNYWKSPEGRQYAAGASAWAEGALRIATGAAAQQQEIDRVTKTYFAQPGDDPATVEFKKQLRGMYSRAIQAALGERNIEGGLELPNPEEFAETVERPLTFEQFSQNKSAIAAAERYGVTLEEMWQIKQGQK